MSEETVGGTPYLENNIIVWFVPRCELPLEKGIRVWSVEFRLDEDKKRNSFKFEHKNIHVPAGWIGLICENKYDYNSRTNLLYRFGIERASGKVINSCVGEWVEECGAKGYFKVPSFLSKASLTYEQQFGYPCFRIFCETINKQDYQSGEAKNECAAKNEEVKSPVNKGSECLSIPNKETHKNDIDDFITAENEAVKSPVNKGNEYLSIPKKVTHKNDIDDFIRAEIDALKLSVNKGSEDDSIYRKATHKNDTDDFIREKNEVGDASEKKENECISTRQWTGKTHEVPITDFITKRKRNRRKGKERKFPGEKNETVKPLVNKESEDILLNKCKNERQRYSKDDFIKKKSEAENKEQESDVIVDCNNKSNEVQIYNSKILEETSTSFSFGQPKSTERPSTCFKFGLPKPIEKPSTAFSIRAQKLTVLEEMSTGFSFGQPKPTEEKAAENKEKESDVIVDSNNKSNEVQIYNSKKNKATKPYVKKYTEDDVIVNYETEANKFHLPKLKLNDADINVSMEEQNEVVFGSNVSDRVKHARLTDLQISYSTIKAFADKEIEDILQGNSIPSVENCVRCIRNLEKLSQSFRELYTGNKNSDITIKVKYREFKAHKAILRTRSSVFDTMLSLDESATTNDVISIDDCEPDIFDNFLLFIYTGKLENVSSDNLFELYYMAERYAVKDLKNECVYFFKKSLSIETICDMLCLSTKYSETELLQSALRFFAMNLEEVVNTQQWRLLLKENPIKANDLYISALKLGYTKKSRLKI